MQESKFNFGATVKQLNNIMEIRFNKSLKRWDLTYSQFSVIMYLVQNQDSKINQKKIEEVFLLKGPTVTGILKRLEDKSFIVRQVDSTDRRVNYLTLTSKGLELERIVCQEVERLEKETLNNISESELNTLENLLKQIQENLMSISTETFS
ncbi:MarR family winged helix-turn-helix transcriptional regulator [Eubacteriaceae bacterium ES3]|nr:MarR family winged helix-turn-helix transcriptional regulator [Eubacteriaceae bacterium ES3]